MRKKIRWRRFDFSDRFFFVGINQCRYAELGDVAHSALEEYCREVEAGSFPSKEFSPYAISDAQKEILAERLRRRGHKEAAEKIETYAPQ